MMHKVLIYTIGLVTKIPLYSYIIAAWITFILPITPLIHGISALIMVDLVTGIIKTYKLSKKKYKFGILSHIQSSGIGKTLNKGLSYLLLIISAYILGKYIMPIEAGIYFAKSVGSLMGIRELISIGENVNQSELISDFIKKYTKIKINK